MSQFWYHSEVPSRDGGQEIRFSSVFNVLFVLKKNIWKILLAPFGQVITNSNVSLSLKMSKIIVIRPSTNRIPARCLTVGQCLSLSDCSGVYQFFCHFSEVIQEWIHDVSAATQVQAVVPRVLLREIMWYEI